jgi:tellurite resistance protein TerC
MFFMLEGAAERFHLLSYGLASVLLFIGAKMLIAGVWTIPIGVALGVVALLIGASMVASLVIRPKQPAGAQP